MSATPKTKQSLRSHEKLTLVTARWQYQSEVARQDRIRYGTKGSRVIKQEGGGRHIERMIDCMQSNGISAIRNQSD